MSINLLNHILLQHPDEQAWNDIKETVYNIFSQPLKEDAVQDIIKREKEVTHLETLISGAAWDLWNSFEEVVPKTSQRIIDFWNQNLDGKAVLILDGLSVREMPILLKAAEIRGFTIHHADITASALPSETTAFAKSLGFSQRSALSNNSAGDGHELKGAFTEVSGLPWQDTIQLVGSNPNIVLWHTWFDDRIHEYQVAGKGIRELSFNSYEQFTSDDFWGLVDILTNGRELIITSDHGYASTGDFNNVSGEQADYLKAKYKNQRHAKITEDLTASFIPPIDIQLKNSSGTFSYVLGRRKWKNSGGYPTLAHGGLSLMETFVPYIQMTKG